MSEQPDTRKLPRLYWIANAVMLVGLGLSLLEPTRIIGVVGYVMMIAGLVVLFSLFGISVWRDRRNPWTWIGIVVAALAGCLAALLFGSPS